MGKVVGAIIALSRPPSIMDGDLGSALANTGVCAVVESVPGRERRLIPYSAPSHVL